MHRHSTSISRSCRAIPTHQRHGGAVRMRKGLRCCTGRVLIAGLLGFCAGSSAIAAEPADTDGTPTGMMAFFMSTTCDHGSGWNVATNVQGRAVVAVQNSSDVGVIVGPPLQDKTAPMHEHSYQATVQLSSKHAALITGGRTNPTPRRGPLLFLEPWMRHPPICHFTNSLRAKRNRKGRDTWEHRSLALLHKEQ